MTRNRANSDGDTELRVHWAATDTGASIAEEAGATDAGGSHDRQQPGEEHERPNPWTKPHGALLPISLLRRHPGHTEARVNSKITGTVCLYPYILLRGRLST